MKSILAVVLVVSVASIALSQAPATKAPTAEPNAKPQRKPEDYQKCEYKVVTVQGTEEGVQKLLNDAAKEGFELERIVGDRIGIMRRNFRSERPDFRPTNQPGPTS